jgi:protocatechuate 3,4-dioxygenase beta subunit
MKTSWVLAVLTAAATSAGVVAQVAPPPPPPPVRPGSPVVPPTTGTGTQGRGNQPAAKPFVTTGLILGRVIDAGTGRPVSGAVVSLSGGPPRVQGPVVPGQPAPPPVSPPQLLADSEGRFAFRQLTRGSYGLQATKPGYASGAYARNRPNGPSRSLQLDDGEKVVDLTIKVFKFGSISGIVTDDIGEPVVAASVRLYRRNLVAGRRVLSQINQATTDDRGVYRLSSLLAGDYYVMLPIVPSSSPAALSTGAAARMNADATSSNLSFSAPPPGAGGRQLTADGTFLLSTNTGAGVVTPDPAGRGKWRSYATQWYPSSPTAANAEPVSLSVGEERGGIDFGMRYVATSSISGQLIGPGGAASQYVLRLIPNDSGEWTGEPEAAVATTDPNGMFQFLTIPSGSYTLQTVRTPQQREDGATGETSQDPLVFASMPVSVGTDDIAGLVLTLQEGFRLTGRFEFAGSRARPTASQFQIPITVESADGRPATQSGPPSRPTQDGRFTTPSQLPGKYFLRTGGAPGGWMLQAILVNGVDATETPIELTQNITGVVVTFTDQISDVRGTVKGTTAGDDPPAVVVFPSDNTSWKNFGVNPLRMRRTLANAAGNFSLGSLPSGDYFAIAVPEEFSSEWQDPAYLEVLSRTAFRFALSLGERRTVELSVQDVRPPGIRREVSDPSADLRTEGLGPFVPDAPPPQQTRDAKPIASQPAGAGSVSGIVMQDDGPARPARLARVSVRGSAINGERVVLSGDDGQFVVDHLPPGSYQVYVTKPAYLPMYYGATRPARGPGTNVVLDGRKPVTDLKITLTRGAVVTGTVFDIEGQPASNVRVQMMAVQTVDGERVLTNVAVSGTTLTDDRGMFRVYGVRSGTYVMIANPPTSSNTEIRQLSDQEMRAAIAEAASGIKAAAMPTDRIIAPGPPGALPAPPLPGIAVSYSPVFYPGTVSEQDASAFAVTAGQETGNINIRMSLVPAARIEGVVIGVDGQAMTVPPQVSLQRFSSFSQTTQSIRTFEGGRFQAIGVAPGAYVISVRYTPPVNRPQGGGPPPGPSPTYWAREEIFVNGADLSNLALQLRPPIVVNGTVTIEGAARPKDVQLRLDQFSRPGQMTMSTNVRADAEGVFKFGNLTPGRYRLGASVTTPMAPAPAGVPAQPVWAVKSAAIEGRDAWEGYVDITADRLALNAAVTLTTNLPEVSGQLLSQAGAPVTDMAVVLFTVDRKYWGSSTVRRVKSLPRVTADGTFRFTGLLPGDYCLAVLMDLDSADLQDPAFLEQLLPAGLRMTLAEGDRKVQNVKLAGR